jgi:NAD kinase
MAKVPRVVLVTRPTDYELLLARHGTRGQAAFFLETRGQCLTQAEAHHHRFVAALDEVRRAVPVHWRSTRIERRDLDRFVFEPDDILVALGQDGLVANLAKYQTGQTVIGFNPAPELIDGVLAQHAPGDAGELLTVAAAGTGRLEVRTMVEATLDDGQSLRSLNEVFVGHASHQSARYRIRFAGQAERQSSSGLIVATGTGSTGWARSIHLSRSSSLALPAPSDPTLAYFVREAWPSGATGTEIVEGLVAADRTLVVESEMDEHGVIFGDGIEADRLTFGFGQRVEVRPAAQTLNLLAA